MLLSPLLVFVFRNDILSTIDADFHEPCRLSNLAVDSRFLINRPSDLLFRSNFMID